MTRVVLGIVVLALLSPGVFADNVMVFMKSEPTGAKIFLDEGKVASGITPCVLDVPAGAHKAGFIKEGYEQAVIEFNADSDGKVVSAVLKANLIKLTIETTPPGATITVDGVDAGKSPVDTNTAGPGEHKVHAKLAGYTDAEKTVRLFEGVNDTVRLKLEKAGATPPPPVTTPAVPLVQPKVTEQPVDVQPVKPEKPAIDKTSKFIDVDCWMCGGKGTMATLPCLECLGIGMKDGHQCFSCGGQGRKPGICPACHGSGLVLANNSQGQCAACLGKGKPMCPRCKGTGKVKVENPDIQKLPTMPCDACAGSGRVTDAPCTICKGAGTFGVVGDGLARPCFYCRGTGKAAPPCTTCNGTGVVSETRTIIRGILGRSETVTNTYICQVCAGTGCAGKSCPKCKGKGWVTVK